MGKEKVTNVNGIALVLLLSMVVEKIVQLFKDLVAAIPVLPDKFKPLTIELISLAFGVLLAFQTGINAFELLDVHFSSASVGMFITGLVIGKGANFAHDFFQSFSKSKAAKG